MYGPVSAAQGAWDDLVDGFNALGLSENAILLGFAVLIGLGASAGVVVFYKAIDLAHLVFFSWPERFLPALGQLTYRPVVTGLGLVAAAWVMARFARGNDGLTIPDVQRAVVREGGEIPFRPAMARTAASAITLGAGGSAGGEGPVAVLGAALGSLTGRGLRFSPSRTAILVGAGTAAGISAAFNAPLAGAFFALEEILGSFGVASFAPVVVSSVVAAIVSRSVFGNHPVFPVPLEQGYQLTLEVAVFYPLLGLLAGLVSVHFVRTHFGIGDWVRRRGMPPLALALAGGATVGLLAFLSRGHLVGSGHLAIPLDVFTRSAWYLVALLAIGKVVATSVTLQTGGSGGLFTPALFVGAAVGAAFAGLLHQVFPGLPISTEAYALVGMGSLIAGAMHAPITGILMVFEMTDNSAIMLPLMLSVVLSLAVARRLEQDSLYSGWLRRRGERIEAGTDREVLAGLRVMDAFDRDPVTIPAETTATGFLFHLGAGSQDTYPVVSAGGQLKGVLTIDTLGRIARDERQRHHEIRAIEAAQPVDALAPEDTLLDAVRRMAARGSSSLPVVDPGTGRLLGLLSRTDILGAYERILAGAPVQGR
jgi:CIC family chloride channel protein